MSANDRQVGGSHYAGEIQHWDFVIANDLDYFQGQITKYVTRWKKKNGVKDLEKAQHFLEKYLEEIRKGNNFTNAAVSPPLPHYEVRERFETEGFVVEGDWWRCKNCRERFMVSVGASPDKAHKCSEGADPTPGYIDQG